MKPRGPHFDARKLVQDLGGASAVAKNLGMARTSPYRWCRRGSLSSRTMALIKQAYPDVDMDKYFVVSTEKLD